MAITNKQGSTPRKLTAAQKAERDRVAAQNDAEVLRSLNAWRAMQGLPPKEANRG